MCNTQNSLLKYQNVLIKLKEVEINVNDIRQ